MSASRTRRRMLRMLMLAWLLSRMGQVEPVSSPDRSYIDRERAEVMQQVETSLLSLFGFERRPRAIDRTKVHIPQAMLDLYKKHTGQEVQFTSNFKRPGLHARSANTVRSFTHQGGCLSALECIDVVDQTPSRPGVHFAPISLSRCIIQRPSHFRATRIFRSK